jgi:membrane protein implicated in regulation of membrane protease activity
MFSLSLMYLWWILAFLLIAGEILVPGFFLLWIGLAAGAMGATALIFPNMGILTQVVLFSGYTFASCYAYAKWFRARIERADPEASGLNQRGQRMVGQIYVLSAPIVNGHGTAKVGDGQWSATGSDMPTGTKVVVRRVDGNTLQVEEADPVLREAPRDI